MTTAERFWFALGWAMADEQMWPLYSFKGRDEVATALRELPPGEFTVFVLDYISPANEMRDEVCALAERLAWERSEMAKIQRGEEELDAYASRERAEGR